MKKNILLTLALLTTVAVEAQDHHNRGINLSSFPLDSNSLQKLDEFLKLSGKHNRQALKHRLQIEKITKGTDVEDLVNRTIVQNKNNRELTDIIRQRVKEERERVYTR